MRCTQLGPELAQLYDGFFVHGRPAGGATLDGAGITARGTDLQGGPEEVWGSGEAIRRDARVPVLILQSETDVVVLGGGHARQTDSEKVRLWEIAGAAHADVYLLVANAADDGSLPAEQLAAMLRPTDHVLGMPTGRPINAGVHQHYIGQAAYEHLTRWAAGGTPPPSAPRLAVDAAMADFARDEDGIATGGLRSPWVDVPSQVLSGLGQSGDGFSFLFGTTAPLQPARLEARYPGGGADYLAKFTIALGEAIDRGYVLADDRAEILAVAGITATELESSTK